MKYSKHTDPCIQCNVNERYGRYSYCKDCKNTYQRKQYAEKLAYTQRVKEETPCADCGNFLHPVQLGFDHLPEYTKVREVSKLVSASCSLDRIKEEIAKCEVVCHNCHALRTLRRK